MIEQERLLVRETIGDLTPVAQTAQEYYTNVMAEINIEPLDRGYLVRAGWFAFNDLEELLIKLREYLLDPEKNKYNGFRQKHCN